MCTSISVAMCTYNGAAYLTEQLQSIAAQTVVPDELVVCDDGSTDATVSLLDEFRRAASFPVRVFRNETRLGAAKNFERAVRLCAGDLIFLCDQDDAWNPSKIEVLADAIAQHPDAPYAFSNAGLRSEDGHPLGLTSWEAFGLQKRLQRFSGTGQLELLLKHNVVSGSAMVLRSSFL